MTLIDNPVSLASCSLMCLVGFGVCEKAVFKTYNNNNNYNNYNNNYNNNNNNNNNNDNTNNNNKNNNKNVFKTSSCLALMVVRGPLRFPPDPSPPSEWSFESSSPFNRSSSSCIRFSRMLIQRNYEFHLLRFH